MNEEDGRDIAYIAVAAVILAGAAKVWQSTIRPWLQERVDMVQTGSGSALVTVGDFSVSTVDVVGVAAMFLPVLALLLWVRSLRKDSKSRRAEESVR